MSLEPYLIKLIGDLEDFNKWFSGDYSFSQDGKLKINISSKNSAIMLSLPKAPNVIKPLLLQIKDKIIYIKMTGLSDNLDFEFNKNLNNIFIFIEDELSTELYSNKCLSSLVFGSFSKRSETIKEVYYFLNKYTKSKYILKK